MPNPSTIHNQSTATNLVRARRAADNKRRARYYREGLTIGERVR